MDVLLLIIGTALAMLWYLFRPVYLTVNCKQPSGDYIPLPVTSGNFLGIQVGRAVQSARASRGGRDASVVLDSEG